MGGPSVIYSSNGGNFVSSENYLKSLDWMKKVLPMESNGPQPSCSSLIGRLVGMPDHCTIIETEFLYYSKSSILFCSILCEVEADMKSWPLSYLAENNEQVLTWGEIKRCPGVG